MLEVQQYLRGGKTLEDLKTELGIEAKLHPELPLVILTYNQIESPKMHPIVMECRGLVLELDSWDIVMKPFHRFFNHGESLEVTEKFNWNGEVRADAKEDGSLILMGMYKDHLLVNTRGSWGDGMCGFSDCTWRELVLNEAPAKFLEDLPNLPKMTFIFELCTIHNKIVRMYKEPSLFLLGMFHIKDDVATEQWPAFVDAFAYDYWIKRPKCWQIRNLHDVHKFLDGMSEQDPTFEGFVLVDDKLDRLKIKSKMYVSLHMLRGEGENLFHPRYLLPWVLKGEGDELLTYFPEVKDHFDRLKAKVDEEFAGLLEVYKQCVGIEDQKEFALIACKTPFSSVLFRLKQEHGPNFTEAQVNEKFRQAEALILKVTSK